MKTLSTVARYLSGLIFLVFGLNGFLHFIPQPLPSNPLAVQFFVAATASHYMAVVFLAQIIGGILLLAGRFVPLGLAILAPVLVNILDYHITMNPGGHWSWIGRDDSVVACLPALSDQLRSNLSAAFVAKD